MTTRLAIQSPAAHYSSGFGRQGARRARDDRSLGPRDRQSDAPEATPAAGGEFAPGDRARFLRPRHGLVDALFTLTVIGWLTATVALMVGELYGVVPATVDPTAVASAVSKDDVGPAGSAAAAAPHAAPTPL